MRIAFVVNSLQTGGAEIHTVGLAAALRERGHDCLLVPLLPRTEIDVRDLERVDVGGNGLGDLGAMRRLGTILRDWRVTGRVHPAYAWSFAAILAKTVFETTAYDTPAWHAAAGWVAGLAG